MRAIECRVDRAAHDDPLNVAPLVGDVDRSGSGSLVPSATRGYERGMMKNLGILTIASLIAALTLACGSDKKAKSPESNSGITETSSQPDMPPAPSKEDPTAKSAGDKDPSTTTGPAGGMIPLAALKVVPAKKEKPSGKDKSATTANSANAADKAIELKADGTVLYDGKAVAKIAGDQVQDTTGNTLVTVGVDGSLVGNGVKAGMKFQGEDLVTEGGNKLSIADDGTLNATKDGKTEAIGKVEGGTTAKRAALIVVAVWMMSSGAPGTSVSSSSPGTTKAAADKPGTEKPGTKTSAEKPAGDKKTPAKK
jgi:hypothetical protein